jgi:hypothetical protein
MDTDVLRGPRLASLAILVLLTGALVYSVNAQHVAASRLQGDEMRMRQACRQRLVRAVDEARRAGDDELADWIQSLPVYHPVTVTGTPARPAAP